MAISFQQATDILFDPITHQDLARALGISLASIRQARLGPNAKAHRPPPRGWEKAVTDLARARLDQYQRLLDLLADDSGFPSI